MLKTLLAVASIIISLVIARVSYGFLQCSVAANTGNIEKHDKRIDEVEDDGRDMHERLIRIETNQGRLLDGRGGTR